MRIKHLILIFGIIAFTAGCMFAPEDIVLDSFEGPINKETVDYGVADGSTIEVTADTANAACGAQSLRVEYDLKPSGYMWIARGYGLDVKGAAQWNYKPEEISWKRYNAITIQMYGSGSDSVVAFDLKDKGGELWRFLLDDDFKGWKEIVCPFEHFFPRGDWQPETAENNEVLDFPIMSFQFEPRLGGKGSYTFDCIKVIRTK
jgi:Carbohydrate binding domain (family 11)